MDIKDIRERLIEGANREGYIIHENKLNETSINRMYKHMVDHDTAILTAFRDKMTNCTNKYSESNDTPITRHENLERNRELKAVLMKFGYQVTSVSGSYIEGYNTDAAKEVKENSYFVVNANDDSSFINNIAKLGEVFCQDSVLIIPKGGNNSYLVGTNNTEFPGYGNKTELGKFVPGKEAEFMTRVNNKPFHFSNEKMDAYENYSRNGKLAITTISSKIIKEHFIKNN